MIRVYQYGLLDPTSGADLVDEQIRKAHRYRNVLVEIERERRTKVREILSGHPDVEALEAEVAETKRQREVARLAIKATRQRTRSRSESAESRAIVRALGALLKERRAVLKAAKHSIAKDPVIQGALSGARERSWERIREERARCGVYWGTYLLVEDAAHRASKEKTDPRFCKWTGEGRVGVQLQGGLSIEDLFGDDLRIQVGRVSIAAHLEETPRGERRRMSRTTIRMRVGTTISRDPIWAEWPMILHRPLPEGGQIKMATISRDRRDCRRWRWTLLLHVELPDGTTVGKCGDAGRVAVNPGWRQREDGMRVGYYVGDDGERNEIVLPAAIPTALSSASALRSIRDQHLDTMQAELSAWLADAEIPEWLRDRTSHIGYWRSAARFASLARLWRGSRFDGDAKGYDLLEAWRYRDEHLERCESGQASRALRRRREEYRLVAMRLADRYSTLVLDNTDYRQFQRSPAPEAERVERDAVKLQQRRAAPSELRLILSDAFRRRGGRVVIVEATDLTRTCHICQSICQWDQASDVIHTCETCSTTWDQDENAARNMLARERLDADKDTVTARSSDFNSLPDVEQQSHESGYVRSSTSREDSRKTA